MKYTLRPYQEEAVAAIIGSCEHNESCLLQAATGAGKTIILCEAIRRIHGSDPKATFLFMAHRAQIVSQTVSKIKDVAPDITIRIACASVGVTGSKDATITVGTPQTLAGKTLRWKVQKEPGTMYVVIDECHRLPGRNEPSQYGRIINGLANSERVQFHGGRVRLIGVTATPYRLGAGYIYGDNHSNRFEPWFERLDFSIDTEKLQSLGFLSPLRGKAPSSPDLSDVKITGNDYNLQGLSAVMSKPEHVGSIAHAINGHASARKHIVVFCVTIDHAERVRSVLLRHGISCGVIHSKMSTGSRASTLEGFDSGAIRAVCNVGCLTEGWDSPHADCIILARPTMSPALFVQMVGRGLRIAEGKTDCLLLDLSGNWMFHGGIYEPNVTWGRRVAECRPRCKTCPQCFEVCQSGISECPSCGHVFPKSEIRQIDSEVPMSDIDTLRLGEHQTDSAKERLVWWGNRTMDAEYRGRGRKELTWSNYVDEKKGRLLVRIKSFSAGYASPHIVVIFIGDVLERGVWTEETFTYAFDLNHPGTNTQKRLANTMMYLDESVRAGNKKHVIGDVLARYVHRKFMDKVRLGWERYIILEINNLSRRYMEKREELITITCGSSSRLQLVETGWAGESFTGLPVPRNP